ncbi:MAG: triosephosphate isomerase [uncultured bacterium]|nr:MAG: triosephosphate isomerase [uncultured bacterium]
MTRQAIIAANWKMNITASESEAFIKSFLPLVKDNKSTEIVICPPASTLDRVRTSIKNTNMLLGGQNIYFEKDGAFTGENSAAMLLDLDCKYVILGHSERRAIFNETNDIINKKIRHALASGLKAIVCVGETLAQREAGKTTDVIEDHVANSLKGLSKDDMKNIVIAYEPVWAIGTGKTATPEQAEEAHAFTRDLLKKLFGTEVANHVRIQYGGSVKPDNIKELMGKANIDGALVGGASLKPDSFSKIVNYNL